MKSKKIVALMCLVAMTSTLMVGCGKKEETSTNAGSTSSSESSSEKSEEKKYDKHIKFSMADLGTMEIKGDKPNPIYDLYKEKFNIEIEKYDLGWDTWEQQVNTWVASGDMPDVLVWDFKPNKKKQLSDWAGQSIIRELPDLSKYPNLEALSKKITDYEQMKVDGKIYCWPKYRGENSINDNNSKAMMYRKDWAKKLNVYKENDEYTMDEFLNVLKAFKEKNPSGNAETIPMTEVSYFFGYMGESLFNEPAYKKVDDKWIWTPALPGKVDAVKFMNKMYKDGLYYKDFYTAKDGDVIGSFNAGRIGGLVNNWTTSRIETTRKDMKKTNPNLKFEDTVALAKLKGKDGKYFTDEMESWWSALIFSANADDEKMERIFDIMEWSAGPEGTEISAYGVEGKDWKKNGDKVDLLWEKEADGTLKAPEKLAEFRYMAHLEGDLSFLNPNTDKYSIDLYKNFTSELTGDKVNLVKKDYKLDYFTAPFKDKYGDFVDETRDAIRKIMISSNDVEKDYKAWVDSMMPRVNKVLDELNKNLK